MCIRDRGALADPGRTGDDEDLGHGLILMQGAAAGGRLGGAYLRRN